MAEPSQERNDEVNGETTNQEATNITSDESDPKQDTTIVYWDYDNMPIPSSLQIIAVIENITNRINQLELHKEALNHDITCDPKPEIEFKLYSTSSFANHTADLSNIEHIRVPSSPNTSKTPLMISTDMALKLLELQHSKESTISIVLISNHDDYAHILSKIRNCKQSPISRVFYITFKALNESYNVDGVISMKFDCTDATERRCRTITDETNAIIARKRLQIKALSLKNDHKTKNTMIWRKIIDKMSPCEVTYALAGSGSLATLHMLEQEIETQYEVPGVFGSSSFPLHSSILSEMVSYLNYYDCSRLGTTCGFFADIARYSIWFSNRKCDLIVCSDRTKRVKAVMAENDRNKLTVTVGKSFLYRMKQKMVSVTGIEFLYQFRTVQEISDIWAMFSRKITTVSLDLATNLQYESLKQIRLTHSILDVFSNVKLIIKGLNNGIMHVL
eukprot:858347_1